MSNGVTISTASANLYLTSTSNPLTITSTGSVTSTGSSDAIDAPSGTAWQINNAGTISGVVGTSAAGIYSPASGITIQNTGKISGHVAGLYLTAGGTIVNGATGQISATGSYGVYVSGAAATVTNLGTISGAWYAVDLTFSSASNRVVVAPSATFTGLVSGGNGVLELSGSGAAGTLSGTIGGTSGSFENFSQLVVDAGAVWALSGALQITAVQLAGSLEVASDTTSSSQIAFASGGKLIIDNAASFSGPVLSNFVAGDTIDIHNFSAAGAAISYNSATGVATITNSASQTATLDFSASTLGAGQLLAASDGGTGIDVTLGSSTAPAAPTITSPASGSTDTTTAEPTISGTGVAGDTVTLSIDGGASVTTTVQSNGSWSYTPTSPLSNASHTITATQAASGGPSSTAATDTFTVNVSGGGQTISSTVTGPFTLSASSNPLTITSAGSVNTTASGADGIDGDSSAAWSINNAGTVSSSQRYGISLHGAGSSILNSGSISGYSGSGGYGVDLEDGGSVSNAGAGSISGGEDGIFVNGAAGTIINSGRIISSFDDGIGLFGGGSITNNAGAMIQAPTSGGFGPAAVYIPNGSAHVINDGSISGQYGVYLGVAGTVENAGTISGTSSAVEFAVSSSANQLIVDPGAVFSGSVNGNGGVLELTAGTGSIGSIGSSSFSGFQTLIDDPGGDWTLTGSNSIANVTDNGSLVVAGSLHVSTAVSSTSTGQFDLQAGGLLEVAADAAANSQIDFLGASQLTIDNAALFGTGVGGSSYAGPLLENFVTGDTIDLHSFSATGAALLYNPADGLLQITNGSSQVATLDFQNSTLGTGSFSFASDGSGGIKITRGSVNIAPAGVTGEAVNLGLSNPTVADLADTIKVSVTGAPLGWFISGGTQNPDGSWTIETADPSAATITTATNFVGAAVLGVAETWTNADGTVGMATASDNVEAYAAASPIFAWSGNDNLTGSSGHDTFVFSQPIGNDVVHSFDVSSDTIDLIGYSGFTTFVDVQAHTADDTNGNAVIKLADGQTITLDGVHTADLTSTNFEFDVTPTTKNPGTMTIGDGAMLPLSGVIDNTGTIALNSAGRETDLELIEHGTTLKGGRQVNLSDNTENVIFGTSSDVTLTNLDNTIQGAGQLGQGQLNLVNEATINASGTNALVIDTGSNPIVNSGTLEATGSGGLVVNSAIQNSGNIWADGGNVTVNGAVTGNGTATISGSSTLEFSAASNDNTSFAAGATGTLKLDHAENFTGSVSGFGAGDALDLADIAFGANLTVGYSANATGTGGTLSISDTTHSASIALFGQFAAAGFDVGSDAGSGTMVTYTPPDQRTASLITLPKS